MTQVLPQLPARAGLLAPAPHTGVPPDGYGLPPLALQEIVDAPRTPSLSLSPQRDWLAVVQALVASGKTVVSVLHEISMALQAQNLLILREGRVAHQGRCDDPLTHRALEAVFEHRITIQAVGRQWVALPRLLPTVNAPF